MWFLTFILITHFLGQTDLALEMQQFDDTDPRQMFQISRCRVSDPYCAGNHHPTTGYSHNDSFIIRSVLDTAQEVYFWQCQNPLSNHISAFEDLLMVCGRTPFVAAACVATSKGLPENVTDSFQVCMNWSNPTNNIAVHCYTLANDF